MAAAPVGIFPMVTEEQGRESSIGRDMAAFKLRNKWEYI
jgi:hypothetical protein